MKMKSMLAASLMVFACSCQNQGEQNQNMQQDQNRPKPAGGCGSCETPKPQTLPKEESKPTAAVPSVAQQTTEASAPATKNEAKAP